MIRLKVIGLKEGEHPIEIFVETGSMEGLKEEFKSEISILGTLTVYKNKVKIDARVECDADLICDRSGEIFTERLGSDFKFYMELTSHGVRIMEDEFINEDLFNLEGDKIEFADFIKEELALAIPMKKVSPKFRDKDLEDLYPEYSAEMNDSGEEKKSPFEKLKKLNFN